MKKQWYYSLAAKISGIVLTVLLSCMGLGLMLTAGIAVLLSGANGSTAAAQEETAAYFLSLYDWEIARDYVQTGEVHTGNVPFTYVLTDEQGKVLASTYKGEPYMASSSDTYTYYVTEDGAIYEAGYEPPDKGYPLRQVTATLYADKLMQGDTWMEQTVHTVGRWHNTYMLRLWLGAACFLLVLVLVIYLHCAAGHRPGREKPVCNAMDRVPFDLFLGMHLCVGFLLACILSGVAYSEDVFFLCVVIGCVSAVLVAQMLEFTLSLATRIKTHTLVYNTLIGRLCRFVRRGTQAVCRHLPALWKALLLIGLITACEGIGLLLFGWDQAFILVIWVLEKLVLIPALVLLLLGLVRLQKGIRCIAAGQVEHQVDTAHLPGELCRVAEDVNHISDGMAQAVEARLKSERFKTELITNVSHDIKTPLTSIINYVDLMEKQQPEDPVLQEYLEVLHRQSARLKKLIEDLIEASKASTGALRVEIAPCQLEVLLEQAAGEYTEKAAEKDLTLLLEKPQEPITVLADGRHLWRVFDNLLINACKYAQPGTRVYMDLARQGNTAVITFRNISRTPLHTTGEELMERFVRGDSSRHTEGSGLGLSIARSLMELQGGQLHLTVDGDLFKVELSLPIMAAPPEEKNGESTEII